MSAPLLIAMGTPVVASINRDEVEGLWLGFDVIEIPDGSHVVVDAVLRVIVEKGDKVVYNNPHGVAVVGFVTEVREGVIEIGIDSAMGEYLIDAEPEFVTLMEVA